MYMGTASNVTPDIRDIAFTANSVAKTRRESCSHPNFAANMVHAVFTVEGRKRIKCAGSRESKTGSSEE